MLDLRFVGNYCQQSVLGLHRTANYPRQADVVGLASVDNRVTPRRSATQLQREAGLAHTRLAMNVQVMDTIFPARCVESETCERSGQLGRDLRRFLVGGPMYFTRRPVVELLQPIGNANPARRYGGMLIAPLGESFAPIDLYVPARYSSRLGVVPQFLSAAPHTSFAGRRTTGDQHESAAVLQRLSRHRLGHLVAQLGRLSVPPGPELPAGIGVAKPAILHRRPGRPSVASGVGCVGVRVDGSIGAAATRGLSAQQFPHQFVQVGIVELSDAAR